MTIGKYVFYFVWSVEYAGSLPDEAFTPMVEKALGKEKVIVVQDALGKSNRFTGGGKNGRIRRGGAKSNR